MKLSCKTIFRPNAEQKIILDSCAFASAKLWNVGNYEKHNYNELGFDSFPNWYDQKKRLKSHYWFKALASQTAQELLNTLHQAWKSFFTLKESGGIENPRPPYYKKGLMSFSFLNNGFRRSDDAFRFVLSKQQREHLNIKHNLKVNDLMLQIPRFAQLSDIKQVRFYPRNNGTYQVIAIYEVPDVVEACDNLHYLSIDLGVNNLATCFDSEGFSFIVSGSQYLNACHYYTKEIAKLQSILDICEPNRKGVSPKMSKLYTKRKNTIDDFLHKATRLITNYCVAQDIHTVVLGDIAGIRVDKNFGHQNNQTFHGLPFLQFKQQLTYKLASQGIVLLTQKEYYTSQCPPTSLKVSKTYTKPGNRKKRGLYVENKNVYNADSVGAFNIMRLFLQKSKRQHLFAPIGLSNPVKVSV